MRTLISLIFVCALVFTPCLHGDVVVVVGRGVAGGAGPTYLLQQDFEGAGYDNSEAWTETGVVNEDYTTAPAPLVGSQSALLSGSDVSVVRLHSPGITAQDEVYVYFQGNFNTFPASTVLTIVGAGVSMERTGGGGLRIGGTVNSTTTTDTFTTGTTYHFLVRYRRDLDGGGGSAIYSVEANTTGTFDSAGNDFAQATTGTDANQCTSIRFHAEAVGGHEWILDKVRLDDVAIGSNPP